MAVVRLAEKHPATAPRHFLAPVAPRWGLCFAYELALLELEPWLPLGYKKMTGVAALRRLVTMRPDWVVNLGGIRTMTPKEPVTTEIYRYYPDCILPRRKH